MPKARAGRVGTGTTSSEQPFVLHVRISRSKEAMPLIRQAAANENRSVVNWIESLIYREIGLIPPPQSAKILKRLR